MPEKQTKEEFVNISMQFTDWFDNSIRVRPLRQFD